MCIKKCLLSLAAAVVLLLSVGAPTLAADVVPMWDNTKSCSATITFSENTAACKVNIQGESGATKIDPKITLQKQNSDGSFTFATIWMPSAVKSSYFSWSDTSTNCVSGANYRLKVEADVTRNGTTETIIVYSDVKTCP